LKRSGHIGAFVIASEEAIAKGIRRIIALTGPAAYRALKDCDRLQKRVDAFAVQLASPADDLDLDGITREINALNEEVSQHTIPYWRKDAMRTQLQQFKKQLLDVDKIRKTKLANGMVDETKAFFEKNPGLSYWVHSFDAGSNAKALDGVLKQVKALSPNTAAMVFSQDVPAEKILCLAIVPKEMTNNGFHANEWVAEVTTIIGGKGGGKSESAQATGKTLKLNEAMETARKYAEKFCSSSAGDAKDKNTDPASNREC
jgi:alanyl-tRNA synthetase